METSIERDLDPAEVEEFLKPYLKRPWDDYDRDFRYLAEHYEELMKQYCSELVAIFDCKVVAHSRDTDELWDELERAGLRWKSPVVDFLWDPKVRLIL